MRELFEIVGFFTCAAVIAFGLSHLLFRLPFRKLPMGLAPGALVRIKTRNGVHRTRFIRKRQGEFVFAAPLQRDHYVPLAVGEDITVEAPMKDGVLLFRSKVSSRDADSHEITLSPPDKIHREDRRESPRQEASGKEVMVEERPAWLLDVSKHGVRFARNGPLTKGERIRLDLDSEPLYGWVLDCSPNHVDGEGSHIVRARLEDSAPIT